MGLGRTLAAEQPKALGALVDWSGDASASRLVAILSHPEKGKEWVVRGAETLTRRFGTGEFIGLFRIEDWHDGTYYGWSGRTRPSGCSVDWSARWN